MSGIVPPDSSEISFIDLIKMKNVYLGFQDLEFREPLPNPHQTKFYSVGFEIISHKGRSFVVSHSRLLCIHETFPTINRGCRLNIHPLCYLSCYGFFLIRSNSVSVLIWLSEHDWSMTEQYLTFCPHVVSLQQFVVASETNRSTMFPLLQPSHRGRKTSASTIDTYFNRSSGNQIIIASHEMIGSSPVIYKRMANRQNGYGDSLW